MKIFDEQLALQQAGGNEELARELFSMLLNELPAYLEKVQSSYQANNFTALHQIVHKINGSATYCGTPALQAAAEKLEIALKQQHTAQTDAGYQQIVSELRRLHDATSECVPAFSR